MDKISKKGNLKEATIQKERMITKFMKKECGKNNNTISN